MPDRNRGSRRPRTGLAGGGPAGGGPAGGALARGTPAETDPTARREARTTALKAAQSASLQAALHPLLDRVGGQVIQGEPAPDDIPVQWLGEVLFHVRLPPASAGPATAGPTAGAAAEPASTDLSDGLVRLIAGVEAELGGPLRSLPRAGKQRAVRLLEERGAFEMRKSAETVAEALGLTRFTVYNYLNRSRADVP